MYTIHRFPEGITLNPREYVLDKKDKVRKFTTKDEAVKFLIPHFDLIGMFEDQGIHIEEEEQ
jgi:hypothetical protein